MSLEFHTSFTVLASLLRSMEVPDAELLSAVRACNPDGIRELLAARASVAGFDVGEVVTACNNDLAKEREMLRLLLDANASAESARVSLVHRYLQHGQHDMLALVLAHGASVNQRSNAAKAHHATPLHIAAASRKAAVVEWLLRHQADVNAPDDNHTRPLHRAVGSRALPIVRMLLDANADPNARDSDLRTPLHDACEKQLCDVVQLLLKHGARVAIRSERGITPLAAAITSSSVEVVRMLLQQGCDAREAVNERDLEHATPLHIACEQGHEEIARLLIAHGAHVDAKMPDGPTPLFLATMRLPSHSRVVQLLVNCGASKAVASESLASTRVLWNYYAYQEHIASLPRFQST